jgi:hypothetical protein
MKYSIIAAAIFITLACGMLLNHPAVYVASSANPAVHQGAVRAAEANAIKRNILVVAKPDDTTGQVITIKLEDYVTFIFRHANGTIYGNYTVHNLLTNGGATDIVNLIGGGVGGGSGLYAKAAYIEATNASMSAAVGDTYCCGGTDKTFYGATWTSWLDPAHGGIAYINTGTGTGTLSVTFTEPATPTAVTIYGSGLTTTSSHGSGAANLIAEANLPATAPLALTGDNVTIVWYVTVTAG